MTRARRGTLVVCAAALVFSVALDAQNEAVPQDLQPLLMMRQGNLPVALLRLRMTKQKLSRGMDINWKFYGDLPAADDED